MGSGEAGEREGGRDRGRVLRSRPGGVWSVGGEMDHNWVVQYVVMETFGVPSLLVSGVEKSRLKRG